MHFTILRPPEKQDGTPINELSLIAFPTRELFQQKIGEFHLIIFDRYSQRGLVPATDGKVVLLGQDLTKLEQGALREKRKEIQMIFQDPYSSLNPRMTIREIIAEGKATAGAMSATLVVHDTSPPSAKSTKDSTVIRRKFSSPPSPR